MTIKDLVIGGAAGAALAVLGTLYFGGATATPTAAASPAAKPAEAAAPAVAPAPSAALVAPAAGRVAAPAVTTASVAPGTACPPPATGADARKAASAVAARVDVPAVALSAEHAKMLLSPDNQPPTLPELHARFAGEPLDPAWSQQMEAQLRQALLDAGVQKGFELLAVECRRTLCELRLFGTGPEAGQRWGAITGQLGQQPWWGQNFNGMSSSNTGLNDRSVIATILHRVKR
ncbi:hypothetical protein [Roseateles sp. P5_E7]